MTRTTTERTPLACLYQWEKTQPDTVHFTQPFGGGRVHDGRPTTATPGSC